MLHSTFEEAKAIPKSNDPKLQRIRNAVANLRRARTELARAIADLTGGASSRDRSPLRLSNQDRRRGDTHRNPDPGREP
jgi:hypothetical protein